MRLFGLPRLLRRLAMTSFFQKNEEYVLKNIHATMPCEEGRSPDVAIQAGFITLAI